MEERDYYAWLSTIKNMEYQKINRLLKVMGTPEKIYSSSIEKLKSIKEINDKDIGLILVSKEKFKVKEFYENLKEKNINFCAYCDEEFPKKIKVYSHSPYYIFYKGKLPNEKKLSIAMIGARSCSNYGRNMAKKIALSLSNSNVQVISGMARGIDTYSQLGALEGKTPTFAILGCGCDICYPTENIELYEEILKKGGGILSEYPPETKPITWHFPQRNRIISGLSDGIAVIEAREKSGSLITVEWALEQGKDIFALPGRVDDVVSKGCNRLIKAGASILTCGKDILEEMNYEMDKLQNGNRPISIQDDEQLRIYNVLNSNPINIEEIAKKSQIDYSIVVEKIMELQLKNMVEEPYQNMYTKK